MKYVFKEGSNSSKMQWFDPINDEAKELMASKNRKALKKRELEELQEMGCEIVIEWEYDPKF